MANLARRRAGNAAVSAAMMVASLLVSSGATAQSNSPEVIRIWPGQAPGTEDWKGPETAGRAPLPGGASSATVGNVTVPTMTVFRPAKAKANGSAIIIAPGGAFIFLTMENEGEAAARWLADLGFTAVVLKYRVHPIPGLRVPSGMAQHPERFAEFRRSFESGIPFAVADGRQAVRYLRKNAKTFGIAPDRIGMMGFSAGAMTTMGVVQESTPADRPDFAAPIYGAMEDLPVPSGAPPIFIAAAQNDALVPAQNSVEIFSRWTQAGRPAELHLYSDGGHGFGMLDRKLPVDGWKSAFATWLRAGGWMTPPAGR